MLGDLRTLLRGIDAYYASPDHVTADGRPTGAANFLMAAGCCSAIDYLARIYTNQGSDEAKAIAFINDFLAPINQRYREAPDLEVLPTRDRPSKLAEAHRAGGRHWACRHRGPVARQRIRICLLCRACSGFVRDQRATAPLGPDTRLRG